MRRFPLPAQWALVLIPTTVLYVVLTFIEIIDGIGSHKTDIGYFFDDFNPVGVVSDRLLGFLPEAGTVLTILWIFSWMVLLAFLLGLFRIRIVMYGAAAYIIAILVAYGWCIANREVWQRRIAGYSVQGPIIEEAFRCHFDTVDLLPPDLGSTPYDLCVTYYAYDQPPAEGLSLCHRIQDSMLQWNCSGQVLREHPDLSLCRNEGFSREQREDCLYLVGMTYCRAYGDAGFSGCNDRLNACNGSEECIRGLLPEAE